MSIDIVSYMMGKKAGGGGGDISLETLNAVENKTYDAPSGKAYNKVIANVPNSYGAGDEGKVVQDGALVAQTGRTVTANGTVDTTTNNEVVVSVEPNLQQKTATENGEVTPDAGYDGLSKVIVNVSGGGGSTSFVDPDFQGSRLYCIINVNGTFRSLSTRTNSMSFFHVQANQRYAIFSEVGNVYLRIHFYAGKTYADDFSQYVTNYGSNEDIYMADDNITGTTELSGDAKNKVFYYTPNTDGEIVVLTNTNTTLVKAYCVKMD